MTVPSVSPLLQEILRTLPRRYQLPVITAQTVPTPTMGPGTVLAIVIEQARQALLTRKAPCPALKQHFLQAMTQLIEEALQPAFGDPVFQAMVLHYQAAAVQDYVALSLSLKQDRRLLRTEVTRLAHPARHPPSTLQASLRQLYDAASLADWEAVAASAQALLTLPDAPAYGPLREGLLALMSQPALARLRRLAVLAEDESVQRYQDLLDQNGPRAGSLPAQTQGLAAQRRGAAVEFIVSKALDNLAQRLNEAEAGHAVYRVVTSMRTPASLPGSHERAKTEWDAVLLRQDQQLDARTAWNVCLLVEAKASADSASSDLPRLQRGLQLLAQADENSSYAFACKQGPVSLRGASLRQLDPDPTHLAEQVLYCSNAPADPAPRLLSAGSRMLLLSETASLQFASAGSDAKLDPQAYLESLWSALLEAPRLQSVLQQYPLQCKARALMVHTDDLLTSIQQAEYQG